MPIRSYRRRFEKSLPRRRIPYIDKKNQAISLSMKVLEKQNENKALDEYNKNNESVGASLGDILKDQMDK